MNPFEARWKGECAMCGYLWAAGDLVAYVGSDLCCLECAQEEFDRLLWDDEYDESW